MRSRSLRRAPQTSEAARCPARKLLVAIWTFAVAARLILIDQPYVDYWSWRQSDVAAIARNFFEYGFRFGYPQIDWAGGSAGYVGTEFPILPFLAAICYKFAGIHEWIGRSQSVIFFAISLPFFFLLVREIFGSTAAIWAAFFYAFAPLNIFAGRSFMPDVPSLSLGIIGLYFFLRWLRDRKMTPFYLAAIAISLSILIKVTSIVIAAPIGVHPCRASVSDARRFSETPYNLSRDRLCRDRRLAFGCVVLACASNRRKILSVSSLRCRWSSTGKFFLVLGHRATNCHVESDADSRNLSADRFVRSAAWKIRVSL